MIKLLFMTTLLMPSVIYADWIDDLSQCAHGKKIDLPQSIKIMKGYIRQDNREVIKLTIQLLWPHKKGIVASTRTAARAIKENVAEIKRDHHKKVLKFLDSLSRNEHDREKFAEQLSAIRVAKEELSTLSKQSSRTATLSEAAKNTAEIVAKELYIQGLKAAMQTSFLLSQS